MAYTNDTLLTAGMGGFPRGDLYHWSPEEYEHWVKQKNAEHDRISHWLNAGSDSIFTTLCGQTDSDIATHFKLSQNYPNPFNPTTLIEFSIARMKKKLSVYDLLGREIQILVNEVKSPGHYTVVFNAQNIASGIYFYNLHAGSYSETKKFILLE